ncbi:MAG: hypothetical protein Q8P33_02230, partial [bacterium]|nr:hypothetical protein [bacterium]
MRLTSFFTFTLASAVLAASFSALATPVSAQSEPTLRYGTPEAAYSNGLSSDEFYDRFAELRDQGNAGSPNTPPTASTPTNINGSSVVADAVDNPPSVSEVRASTTANWLGFIVTGAAVQGMGSAEEVYMAWPDDRDSATDAGIYFTRSLDGGLTWSTDQRIDRAGSTPGTAGIALNLVSDNHGNILIVWDDSRNGST